MKITVESSVLAKATSRALGAADRKMFLPVLGHFLLEADLGKLAVSATDQEVCYRGWADAQVNEPGAVAVHAAKLAALAGALPGGVEVTLEADDKGLRVVCGKSRHRLPILPAEQFPPLPVAVFDGGLRVPGPVLKAVIDRVAFCCSPDQFNAAMGGVLWDPVGDGARLVATDGSRLAHADLAVKFLDKQILPPRKGMIELAKMAQAAETVDLALSEDGAYLAALADGGHLFLRLLGGTFPNYRRIIPETYGSTFVVERAPLAEALRRVGLMFDAGRFKACKFAFGGGKVEVSYETPDGQGLEEAPATGEGEAKIGFNAVFVLEGLLAMSSEKVLFGLPGAEMKPAAILPVGDGPGQAYLLMPITE